jgi:hypothetical protein
LLSAVPVRSEPAPLAIVVGESGITISNVTKGGDVVLFSCARGTRDRRIHVQPLASVLHDEDRDGIVSVTRADGVPIRSVWVAVDFTTGSTAAGAHPTFPLLVSSIGEGMYRKNAAGEIAELIHEQPRIVLLLVRPGRGAWLLRAFDGGEGDRDGVASGTLSLLFEDARSITGKDKAPKGVKKDDVIVAIDPSHLDVFLGRIVQ